MLGCIPYGFWEERMPEDLKNLNDAELAKWTAQWDESSPNRLLGEQELKRRASPASHQPTPPPKWYDSSRGKLAIKVCSAALGAAAGWVILQWSGRILGP